LKSSIPQGKFYRVLQRKKSGNKSQITQSSLLALEQ